MQLLASSMFANSSNTKHQQYAIEKGFLKKWTVLIIDPAISCLNKTLTVPVEDAPVFQDPVFIRLEALFKVLFSLFSLAMQHDVLTCLLLNLSCLV